MVISAGELVDLCEGVYEIEQQISALSKHTKGMLEGYAAANELSKTAVSQAYKAYKSFKEGKVSTKDEDYFTLQAIIEEHFSASGTTEDSVSA